MQSYRSAPILLFAAYLNPRPRLTKAAIRTPSTTGFGHVYVEACQHRLSLVFRPGDSRQGNRQRRVRILQSRCESSQFEIGADTPISSTNWGYPRVGTPAFDLRRPWIFFSTKGCLLDAALWTPGQRRRPRSITPVLSHMPASRPAPWSANPDLGHLDPMGPERRGKSQASTRCL